MYMYDLTKCKKNDFNLTFILYRIEASIPVVSMHQLKWKKTPRKVILQISSSTIYLNFRTCACPKWSCYWNQSYDTCILFLFVTKIKSIENALCKSNGNYESAVRFYTFWSFYTTLQELFEIPLVAIVFLNFFFGRYKV